MNSQIINKVHCYRRYQKICHPVKNYTKNATTIVPESTPEAVKETIISIAEGKNITISAGKLAKLADGCATVSYKDTAVMATAVSKENKQTSSSFTPLTVSFKQKAAALGRIPLNFFRRELGVTENEILVSRIIDRSIRPLFEKSFNWETQIICNPLAMDGSNFPDVLAINAASAALALSDIPWNGPIGAVRVGLVRDEVVINPSKEELENSLLNLIVASREKKSILMLEGFASNIELPIFMKAVNDGISKCDLIIKHIKELQKLIGKEKRQFQRVVFDSDLEQKIESLATTQLTEIFSNHSHDKLSRDEAVVNLKNSILNKLSSEFKSENLVQADEIFHSVCRKVFRNLILDSEVRCDGRMLNEIRPITCEVDLFKPLHGSALFQRGQTQVMCTVSLDSPNSALKLDRVGVIASGIKEKNFFVHYDFPPFATKEVGRLGPVGRREVGHGALAEKALKANIPEDFPFTIRLTSEVLESNGSSSMATVCGGSLALMDAGVPVLKPCAGVAMGLISETSDENPYEIKRFKILTDLLGIEDHFGDMDFKIAGTSKAFTAIQMDVKNGGIPLPILQELLKQGKNAIKVIIQKMSTVCQGPREKKKDSWPVMDEVNVAPNLRSKFLGSGGTNVKKLEITTGVEITEESPGKFVMFAPNAEAMKEAKTFIDEILEKLKEPTMEFGGVYTAVITEITDHGCMVSLYPGMTPALLHLSQLDQKRVRHPSALGMTVGQEIQVKYFGRDPVSGSMRLSRKVLQSTLSTAVRSLIKSEGQTDEEQNKQESDKN